ALAAGAGAAPGAPGAPAGLAPAAAASAFFPLCPLKIRVGANSPSLWPTMFSATYTGMNFRPLWTAIVWPTMSGMIVERRDQVLTTFFSRVVLRAATFFMRWSSTKGPFLIERDIV